MCIYVFHLRYIDIKALFHFYDNVNNLLVKKMLFLNHILHYLKTINKLQLHSKNKPKILQLFET